MKKKTYLGAQKKSIVVWAHYPCSRPRQEKITKKETNPRLETPHVLSPADLVEVVTGVMLGVVVAAVVVCGAGLVIVSSSTRSLVANKS